MNSGQLVLLYICDPSNKKPNNKLSRKYTSGQVFCKLLSREQTSSFETPCRLSLQLHQCFYILTKTLTCFLDARKHPSE